VDHKTADRAALWLGFLFPLIGYPVGIVFMMLDDPRKTQLGRLTLLWSTIGLVLTFVISLIFAAPILAVGEKMLIPSGSSASQSDPTSKLDSLTDGDN
jgi:hypothetical protein